MKEFVKKKTPENQPKGRGGGSAEKGKKKPGYARCPFNTIKVGETKKNCAIRQGKERGKNKR